MTHENFIRQLPCLVCGDDVTVECAHIRFADPRVAKIAAGMGKKPSSEWTIPLCGNHHREQHKVGEFKFWEGVGIDPIFVAMALYLVSGDHEAGEQIIREAQAH